MNILPWLSVRQKVRLYRPPKGKVREDLVKAEEPWGGADALDLS